jgi:hypothetical protein
LLTLLTVVTFKSYKTEALLPRNISTTQQLKLPEFMTKKVISNTGLYNPDKCFMLKKCKMSVVKLCDG